MFGVSSLQIFELFISACAEPAYFVFNVPHALLIRQVRYLTPEMVAAFTLDYIPRHI